MKLSEQAAARLSPAYGGNGGFASEARLAGEKPIFLVPKLLVRVFWKDLASFQVHLQSQTQGHQLRLDSR